MDEKIRIVVGGSYSNQVDAWLYYYKKSGNTTPVLLMYDNGWDSKILSEFSQIGDIFDFSWFFEQRRETCKGMKTKGMYWTTKPAMDFYADCDVMLWTDFDVQINKDLSPLIKDFIKSGKPYGIAGYFNGDTLRSSKLNSPRFCNSGMHLVRPKTNFVKEWMEFANKNYIAISCRDEVLLHHYITMNNLIGQIYRFDGKKWCFDFEIALSRNDSRRNINSVKYRTESMTDSASLHWCAQHSHYVGSYLEQQQKDRIERACDGKTNFSNSFLSRCGILGSPCIIVNGMLSRDLIPVVLCRLGLKGIGFEIGVGNGDYSEKIIKDSMLSKVVSVDLWGTKEQYGGYTDLSIAKTIKDSDNMFSFVTERLSKYGDRSEIWRMKSCDASKKVENKSLDFVYLDSALDYENINNDLVNWFPKIKNGGVMAGHDFTDGNKWGTKVRVMSAVQEFAILNNITVYVSLSADDSVATWFFEKQLDCK